MGMSKALYRLYRPQKFSDVVGQEHVITTLANQVKSGQIGHAYLFTGSRGVGKTSVARILARAANCQSPAIFEPDNACDACQDILQGKSLDLMEIDAASHTGVDNIREIIDHLAIPPSRAKYRTYIIDEVHMLSRGAFNALLKTLEEPPAHALFILATTEAHKVPATIISRTQRFDFKKLTDAEIAKQLNLIVQKEGLAIKAEVLEAIAQSVDGSLRDALVLLEKAIHLARSEHTTADDIQKLLGITPIRFRQEFLTLVKEKDLAKTAKFLRDLSEQGYNLEQFTRDFLEYVRNALTANMDRELAKLADYFLESYAQLRISPVPELPLLVAAVKFAESSGEAAKIEAEPNESSSGSVPKAAANNKEETKVVLNQAKVSEHWLEILERVRAYNQSLLTALKLAKPVGHVNGTITIAFPYKFHADTVNAAKNRLIIERVLEELFGHKMQVRCVTEKEAGMAGHEHRQAETENKSRMNNDLLNSALDILGGEVVN